MLITQIVAHSKNRVIGKDNKLIWNISEDLRHFKRLTLGKCVIMGRKTYESIGKPLKGRTTIILSKTMKGENVAENIVNALHLANSLGFNEVFVVGGESIYRQTLPYTNRVIATELSMNYEGDTFYPELPKDEFNLVDSIAMEEESLLYYFKTYIRCGFSREL